ncbi:MAG: hypothetical protein PVJ57_15115 [Phycisphaerae bacterium]|jgi:hypothetical protein
MNVLLWKDYRLCRPVLIVGAALWAAPFLALIAFGFYLRARYGEGGQWLSVHWEMCGVISLGLSVFTIAMLAGEAFATERNDRSADFLAYLPISLRMNLISKGIWALGPSLLIWGLNLLIIFVLVPAFAPSATAEVTAQDGSAAVPVAVLAAVSVLAFGGAWCFSTFMSNHALAMFCGILSPFILGLLLQSLSFGLGITWLTETARPFEELAWGLGIVTIVGGSIYYLRRITP